MLKTKRAQRSLSLRTNFSRTVRSRHTLIELLESRQLLTASTPVRVPSPFTYGSNPQSLLTIGNITYFAADDGIHGIEVWKTDGTAAGTMLVKDINPGCDDGINSHYDYDLPEFTNVNGTLFFVAYDGIDGPELWKSDGTAAGTALVKDINSRPHYGSYPAHLTNVNGTLFFTANKGVHDAGVELWKSDGTADGTTLVADFPPEGVDSYLDNLTDVNGRLFFTVNDGTHGNELWKSDGTAAGTEMVEDINPGSGSSGIYHLANLNGTLFFNANDGIHGNELWKTDGTAAGTVMVADINPGSGSSYAGYLTNVNGTLFFTADDGMHDSELWKTDGTAAGTVMVADVVPDSGNPYLYLGHLTNVNGTLFFLADDNTQLWKSDGTTAGTVKVADINPGGYSGYRNYSTPEAGLKSVNGTLFFSARGAQGYQLWKSDGTAAGTIMVADINLEQNSSIHYLTDANGTLFFSANDGIHGRELWKSDGTAAGTLIVADINTTTSAYLVPSKLIASGGTLFFTASNPFSYAIDLWKTDGTAAGTVMLANIYPYVFNWDTPNFDLTDVNGTLFFRADDIHGFELWKSDGTAVGTVMVADINPSIYGVGLPSYCDLTNVNGTLFFVANDDIHGNELWKSDGTAAGTVMVKDITPGSDGAFSYLGFDMTDVNGTLFFTASDGTHGYELWKSDGTADGTVMVADISPGTHTNDYSQHTYANSSDPSSLTNVNGTLFFTADDRTHGEELWKSDGSAAGTVLVKDIYPGTDSYLGRGPMALTSFDKALFFTADDGIHGLELWKSDGTVDGTMMVADINPSSDSFYFAYLTDVNGTLFFAANDGTHGQELWKSDGTAAGTVMVKDISPGIFTYSWGTYANSSQPRDLTNVNGTLFFTAYDGFKGAELWKTDGTTDGTVMVGDIDPGSGSSWPYNLTSVYGALFFEAVGSDDRNAPESLYYLAPQLILGDFNADGQVNSSDIGPAMQALANPSDYETQYNIAPPYLSTIGDVNGDGQFTAADLQTLLNRLNYSQAPVAAGDFNRDGHVNAADIGPAMQALSDPAGYEAKYVVSPNNFSIIGDINGDGQFTNADLQRLLYMLRTGGGSLSSEQNTPAYSNNNSNAAGQPAEAQTPIATETPVVTISNDAKPVDQSDAVSAPSPNIDTTSNSAPLLLTPEPTAIYTLITASSWSNPTAPASSHESSVVEPSSHHAILAAIDQAFLATSDLRTRRQRWHIDLAKSTANTSESPSLPPLLAHWPQH